MKANERGPLWHGIAWRGGEDGSPATFRVALPKRFRDTYLAAGRLKVRPDHSEPPTILAVTVTDRDTGARVRMRGDRVTLDAAPSATHEYVGRLWQDARIILGVVYRQMGRGPGAIRDDDQIRRVVSEMRRDDRKPINAETIAAYSGMFSPHNLRYYLRTRGRRLRDFL
jgi:hypothetical protein